MASDILFGTRLKELREDAGISRYRLEQLSGVSRMTIMRIEGGIVSPSIALYAGLLDCLGAKLEIVEKKDGL